MLVRFGRGGSLGSPRFFHFNASPRVAKKVGQFVSSEPQAGQSTVNYFPPRPINRYGKQVN